MSEPRRDLDSIIESVVEGRDVDWASAQSNAAGRERRLLEQLRLLSRLGACAEETDARSPSALVAGDRWGAFELLERLGQGAFGEVWRARDVHLDREVALKLLPDSSRESAESAPDLVIQEGHLLSRVRHLNVVTVYGASRHNGRVGLWMERIHGETLGEQMKERGRFDAPAAALIGIDLCRALAAVHDAGLVHRDVKPQNVMRDTAGGTILMDLGVGVDLRQPRESSGSGGTPLYAAPELFQRGAASAASDLYSVGVLLFHLVTGSYPVRGETLEDVARAHAQGDPRRLRDLRPDLPEAFVGVVERALEPDPARRFQNAGEMARALEMLSVGHPAARHLPRVVVAGVAIVLLTVGTMVWHRSSARVPNAHAGQSTWQLTVPRVWGPGAISADGSTMVFTDLSNGVNTLDVESGAVRALVPGTRTTRAQDTVLLNEPAGQVLYSWHDDQCGCAELRVVPLSGGSPRSLVFPQRFSSLTPIDLAADGVHLLATVATADDPVLTLAILDLEQRTQTQLMPASRNLFASLAPDARFVAYSLPAADDEIAADLSLLEWRTGKVLRLTDGPADDVMPLWIPDGGGILFQSDRAGARGLWQLAIENGQPKEDPVLLQRDMGRFISLRLSPGGILSYFRSPILDLEIATFDPERGRVVGKPVLAPVRIVGANTAPSWSPNGKAFVYSAERKPWGAARSTLVIHSRTDGLEHEFSVPVNGYLEPAWSPDGRTLLIRGPGAFDDVRGAHTVDATTGRVIARFRFPIASGIQWARDGQSFLYLGPQGIHRMHLDAERPEQIKVSDEWKATTLAVSPDGRQIAANAQASADESIIITSVDGQNVRVVARAASRESVPTIWDWTPDGRFLLGVRPVTGKENTDGELVTVRVSDGEIMAAGLARRGLGWVRISPDGREVLYRIGLNQRTLWLMDGLVPSADR